MTENYANARFYRYKYMGVYNISFRSMGDLYLFLKCEPAVNKDVFYHLSSIEGSADFAGEPYEKAVRYCIDGYDGDYKTVMKMKKELEKYIPIQSAIRHRENSFAGSHPNVPAFIAGSPKAMYRLERSKEKKFCTVWFNLAYPSSTTKNAVINRGAVTLSLIDLLESRGFIVNFKVFMSVYCRDEIFLFEIVLKNPQERLSIKKCCYPICAREFTRRIIMRIMESVPFRSGEWYPNYGLPLSDEQSRALFGLESDDMLISSPYEMGISGDDIISDGKNMLKKLGIDRNIFLPEQKYGERL